MHAELAKDAAGSLEQTLELVGTKPSLDWGRYTIVACLLLGIVFMEVANYDSLPSMPPLVSTILLVLPFVGAVCFGVIAIRRKLHRRKLERLQNKVLKAEIQPRSYQTMACLHKSVGSWRYKMGILYLHEERLEFITDAGRTRFSLGLSDLAYQQRPEGLILTTPDQTYDIGFYRLGGGFLVSILLAFFTLGLFIIGKAAREHKAAAQVTAQWLFVLTDRATMRPMDPAINAEVEVPRVGLVIGVLLVCAIVVMISAARGMWRHLHPFSDALTYVYFLLSAAPVAVLCLKELLVIGREKRIIKSAPSKQAIAQALRRIESALSKVLIGTFTILFAVMFPGLAFFLVIAWVVTGFYLAAGIGIVVGLGLCALPTWFYRRTKRAVREQSTAPDSKSM